MVDLPLISAVGMTRAQRDGRACASCRKTLPRPTIPVGQLATGEVVYRCQECLVTLEPVEPGPERIMATPSESERPR